MWATFVIGIVICCIILYFPGYLFFRSVRFPHSLSVFCGPVFSVVLYGIVSIVLGAISVPANCFLLFFVATAVGAIFLIVSRAVLGLKTDDTLRRVEPRELVLLAAIYLVCSTILTLYIFIKPLDGPASFYPGNDSTTHLNTIAAFIDTGNWSSIAGGYYPRGWAGIATIVAQALGVSAPFAANVVNATLVAVVYPLSMLCFLSCVFQRNLRAIALGAVCTLALVAFPWNYLVTNPLGPNILGFSLLPVSLSLLMLIIERIRQGKKIASLSLAFLLFCASTFFSHPNTLFTTGVFFIPYAIYSIATWDNDTFFPKLNIAPAIKKTIAELAFITAVCVLWWLCFTNPLLASTVHYVWKAFMTVPQAASHVLLLSFNDNPAQWVAALLIFVGIIQSLFKREYLWMSFGFAFFCLAFFMDVITDAPIKNLLTGFWYTSIRRLAGAAAIMGVPLLVMGLNAAIDFVQAAIAGLLERNPNEKRASTIALAGTVLLFVLFNYAPNIYLYRPTEDLITTYGYLRSTLAVQNDIGNNEVLEAEERDFLAEVKQVVGDDLVFNISRDGSGYAYCLNGINVYYTRYWPPSNDDALVLREHLDEYATNDDVQLTIEALDVNYLLLLDVGYDDESTVFSMGNLQVDWPGVATINDETPGFEAVLSEGDMRLYRINRDN